MNREEKILLRRKYREKQAGISAEACRKKSESIRRQIAETKLYTQAKAVLFYASMQGEPDLLPLLEQALREGKRAALPRCSVKAHTMDAVEIHSLAELTPGAYGIPEPVGEEILAREEIDMILVPALAFDENGMRLGRGAGYYDRYLDGYGGKTIGVCFSECKAERLPAEPHDMPVDAVITEKKKEGNS